MIFEIFHKNIVVVVGIVVVVVVDIIVVDFIVVVDIIVVDICFVVGPAPLVIEAEHCSPL